jgi:four helix bundle protein
LNDAEAEAAETQPWLQFAVECQYLDNEEGSLIYQRYNQILGKLVTIINHPAPWIISK